MNSWFGRPQNSVRFTRMCPLSGAVLLLLLRRYAVDVKHGLHTQHEAVLLLQVSLAT